MLVCLQRAHNELGDFFVTIADYNNAISSYHKTAHYCSTNAHIVQMCLSIIRTSLLAGAYVHAWGWRATQRCPRHLRTRKASSALGGTVFRRYRSVSSLLVKAENKVAARASRTSRSRRSGAGAGAGAGAGGGGGAGAPSGPLTDKDKAADAETAVMMCQVKACAGIYALNQGNFQVAARHFLAVQPGKLGSGFADVRTWLRWPRGGGRRLAVECRHGVTRIDAVVPSQVTVDEDVAIYAGLCALASIKRGELTSVVLKSKLFDPEVGLAPTIRRSIVDFCESRYDRCMATVETFRVRLEHAP